MSTLPDPIQKIIISLSITAEREKKGQFSVTCSYYFIEVTAIFLLYSKFKGLQMLKEQLPFITQIGVTGFETVVSET